METNLDVVTEREKILGDIFGNMNNYCDFMCKYAEFPEKLCDGAKTCRTFVGVYCKKKKQIVHKNKECNEFELRKRFKTRS